jgi:hypothetical protein
MSQHVLSYWVAPLLRFSGGPNTELPLRKKVPARQSSGPFGGEVSDIPTSTVAPKQCARISTLGNFLE